MAAVNSDGNITVDENVEIWKIKQLIKNLEMARGNGTSMISLHIPPKDQISRHSKMLTEEAGTAANIKKSVNRLSVLSAITSVQAKLRLYSRVPPNGLVIYCGTVVTEEGKEKKINIDFEPFKPITRPMYLCDNRFHVEALKALLTDDSRFGFIIMDGNGALFGTLQGSVRQILQKFCVELPPKHGRGGQSALRFARHRLEKRHNFVRKVAETAAEMFIQKDAVLMTGLVLAGSADFKNELAKSDMFDPRLRAKVVSIVDTAYGGENGFHQAIQLSSDTLRDVKFLREKMIIERYFEEIAQDSGLIVYGVEDTLKALELGAIKTLICWEDLDDGGVKVQSINGCLTPHHRGKGASENEAIEGVPLLEWLSNNYVNFGATLELVTDRTREGAQFVRGFGGIGGMLRYKVEFQHFESSDDDEFDFEEY